MSKCPACAVALPEGSRYCPACGTALSADAQPEHHSTVLFDSDMLASDGAPDPIEHGSFIPGTIIGERYRIVGLLGKGGMGEVYRADDLKLGQTVALKFLPVELADDQRRRDRFLQEVRIARQVAHPNLCRVFDIGDLDGRTYLSMEFVDGEDLSSLLRRIGRVPRTKAIEIARQICVGLTAAHERGILHRDLKPANIMIDGRGKVRITDFGLAVLAGDIAGAAARAGTPAYMSPEQLTGKEYTVRSEVYTLGLLLYELFTGKRAFQAGEFAEYVRLHTEVRPTAPSRVIAHMDPEIERAVLRCLEKDPALRPASPLEVAASLPGADALTAALAAGEIPSPELVAFAAPREGTPLSVNCACLVLILCGLAAFPFLNDNVKLHAFVPLNKPPAVLIDNARQIIRNLGYSDRPTDWAYGFDVDAPLLRNIEQRDRGAERWATLTTARPSAIRFWYRQGPRNLIPRDALGSVTFDDPPPTTADLINVRLDVEGRLISFVAPPSLGSTAASSETPWGGLFAAAGLDARRFRSTSAHVPPPVFCDQAAAWIGTAPENPSIALRVEAGAYRGRPVYFDVRHDALVQQAEQRLSASRVGELINVVLLAIALGGAAALARRNLAQGRGDRRGAFRVSVLVGAVLLAAWFLRAHHVTDAIEELRLLSAAAGRSLLAAGICWLLYISLEPYVRQRRPEILISWNRFLSNRFNDPLLGCDILIGGLFGLVGASLTALLYFVPSFFDAPPPRPAEISMLPFMGLRGGLANIFQIITAAVLVPIAVLLFLLLLLVLLRSRALARIALAVLLTGISTMLTIQPGGNIYVNLAVYGTLSVLLLFVLLRFGLLALIIGGFFMLLLENFPITADMDSWYRDASLGAVLLAGGLALYGFSLTVRGARQRRRRTFTD